MKRSITLLLALCLLLAACAAEPAAQTTPEATQPQTSPQADLDQLYDYLKNWLVEHGTVNGDYVFYSNTADHYGGFANEDFSLVYWGDTDTVEFCLHAVISEEEAFNTYLRIPKSHTGSYEYITSWYERETGASICESTGFIEAAAFTKNYPLRSESYFGSDELQTQFMENSRVLICDTIDCMGSFLRNEQLDYTLEDLGFAKFAS